ncbi:hypothetical protein HPB50_029423 [Hyalomma asiaticum]|nr:hypothetical protein HPB50_029423 [Hyalomma asiaticum]
MDEAERRRGGPRRLVLVPRIPRCEPEKQRRSERGAWRIPRRFDVLTVDFVMVLLALALPASSSSLLEAPTREYNNLWFRLPWTALLTLGCSGYLAEAVRASDMVGWLANYAPHSAQYKFVTQLLLTLGAAVLTELVGRKATVTLMMPVIMDIVSTH